MRNESADPAVTITRYDAASAEDARRWNEFLPQARCATFLLHRDYMDYHRDRFVDHSALICENGKLVAVFPANARGKAIISHGGLTYGGLLYSREARLPQINQWMRELARHYAELGFEELIYKKIPEFYQDLPAVEDEYALLLLRAELSRCETSFVVLPIRDRLPIQERRRRSIRAALKAGVEVRSVDSLGDFWNEVLTPHLQAKFGVAPVHSLEEIELLRAKFPAAIGLSGAFLGGKLVAGALLFRERNAVHAQYISSTPEGRDAGALDLLFSQLVDETLASGRAFSFGTANAETPDGLNRGLVEWKEGFGARAMLNRFYRLPLGRTSNP